MPDVIWATPLYEFLRQCNQSPLQKVVLDCGAGGKHPAIYVNFLSVDDPDDRPFCETSPLRSLLGSERFAKHEDDEPDAHFCGFDILPKEKQLIDKVHGQARLKQAYIEYIVRKRRT